MSALGAAYRDACQYAKAAPLCQEAVKLIKAGATAGTPQAVAAMCNLARLQMTTGDHAGSEKLLTDALPYAESRRLVKPLESAEVQLLLGDCLLRQRQFARAEDVLRVCLSTPEDKDADGWRTFCGKALLGTALVGQHKLAEAEPLLVAGYQGMKNREVTIPVPDRLSVREALDRLIRLYDAWGKKAQAEAWRNPAASAPAKRP